MESVPLEVLVPPLPVPGCTCLPATARAFQPSAQRAQLLCSAPYARVCNPLRSADLSNSEWDALRGRWARQQTTAFPLQKLQRLLPDQPPADLTEEELQEFGRTSLVASEWLSHGQDRSWVKSAFEVIKKAKLAHKDVKTYFCRPVPIMSGKDKWNDSLVLNYNSIILHKMDLGTIEAKLKEGGFASPAVWENAMRSVFRNSFVFNRRGDPISDVVLDAAEAASTSFELEMLRLKGVSIVN